MRKIIPFVALLFVASFTFAQAPQQFSYQAVIRKANNALVTNSPIGMYISILKDSINGSEVYAETQTATTNANGLVSVAIGAGQIKSGTFASINWGSGTYYIKTATDPTGGSTYSIVGASQLLSVPYALYAANGTTNGTKYGDMQYWDGTKWAIIPAGNDGSTLTLCNGKPTWGACVVIGLATVSTTNASSINTTSAVSGGSITADGGSTVTARGNCYATTANPTISNSIVSAGSGTGTFSTTLSNLTANTTYHTRAYATNSAGTAYGNDVSFTTTSSTGGNLTLGQSYAGGYIFYLDSSKQHGLIAAPSDQGGAIQWYNGGNIATNATGTAVGTGVTNTPLIINAQGSGSYAASSCATTFNGYSDWFLPSKDELKLMYTNLYVKGIGGFVANYYWSSTEYNYQQAWVQDFGQNSQFSYFKNNTARVRAARAF